MKSCCEKKGCGVWFEIAPRPKGALSDDCGYCARPFWLKGLTLGMRKKDFIEATPVLKKIEDKKPRLTRLELSLLVFKSLHKGQVYPVYNPDIYDAYLGLENRGLVFKPERFWELTEEGEAFIEELIS